MLPKENRLDKKEFDYTFENGRISQGDFFMSKILKGTETFKVGFAIPKKKIKTAPERNLIKRRGYAAIKELVVKETKTNSNLILVYKKQEVATYEQIKNDIKKLFHNLN